MTGESLRYLLRPREVTNRSNLQVLSVYRDHGVIPKSSRVDNFNKTPSDLSRYQEVRPGDLVVNKMKAWQGSLAISSHHGIVSPDYLVCHVASTIDSKYVHYLLRSAPFIAEYGRRSKGIRPAQWRLYWEDLAGIPLDLPSLAEQRRIADFLDAETARIDCVITTRYRQRALLDERSIACVSEAFPSWGDCDFVRLGYLAVVQSGITVDASRKLDGETVTRPYLRVANVQADRLALESVAEVTVPVQAAAGSVLHAGDVLMTEGGDLDKLGRGTVWREEIPKCLHQNHVFAVRPRGDIDSDYLSLLTRTAYAREYFESTGNKTTNLASTSSAKIKDFRVPFVSRTDQAWIVHEAVHALGRIDALAGLLDTQLLLLSERRQALITAAVTGQIDVTTAGRAVSEVVS